MAGRGISALAAAIERHASADGLAESAVPGLALFRATAPNEWGPAIYEPAIFVVAQGHKLVRFAGATHRYDPAQYVLSSVDVPVMCRVTKASARTPLLALRMLLDPVIIAELLASGPERDADRTSAHGLVVTPVEPPLLDSVTRLVSLLDTPADIHVLAPLLAREVTWRVLTGPQGARVRQVAASGAPGQRIARAIALIKDHAAESLRMAVVARKVGMGLSAFHAHFRAITGLSPLQFQKHIRLQEARRLMVAPGLTAAEAAFRVGYASPSQFSREYRRAFGTPPRQDAVAILATPQGLEV